MCPINRQKALYCLPPEEPPVNENAGASSATECSTRTDQSFTVILLEMRYENNLATKRRK